MNTAKFIALNLLIGSILIGLAVVLTRTVMPQYSELAISAGILIPMLLSIVSFFVVKSNLQAPGKQFMTSLTVGMMLKMFLGLGAVLIVALTFHNIIDEFVISFFIGYAIFTAFEVSALMRNLRAENKKSS